MELASDQLEISIWISRFRAKVIHFIVLGTPNHLQSFRTISQKVVVTETAFPSKSTIEKCVVSSLSLFKNLPGPTSLKFLLYLDNFSILLKIYFMFVKNYRDRVKSLSLKYFERSEY